MNRVFFISFFLLFSFHKGLAQFRLGPLGGVSVSRFVYEDKEYKEVFKTGFSPGFHLGMALNYQVDKRYSLQTELSFLKKGIDVRYEDDLVKVQNDASYRYLSAPVLLRFSRHKMIGSQHLEFYVNVGPEINYWLGGRGVLETSERADFVNGRELAYQVSFQEGQAFGKHMVVKEPSRLQMALGAGGGFIFDLGRTQNLAFDFRASLGVGKSFHGKDDGGDYGLKLYTENLEGVHHTLSVTASYLHRFDLKILLQKRKPKSR